MTAAPGRSDLVRSELKPVPGTRSGARSFGVITLARPDRRNALTPEMLDDLAAAVDDLRNAGSVALVGEGAVFCAGFDLTLCRDDPGGHVLRRLLGGLSSAILALRSLAGPVVIGAHGAAIAGGCALLGGGDVIVTDTEAKIGYPVVPLGISPAVSAPFLTSSVGGGRARERLLDASLIDGREAVRIGLAQETAKRHDVGPRAVALAQELAAKPPVGLRATKSWLNQLDRSTERAQAALGASLSLTGGDEERRRLALLWNREPNRPAE